MLLGPGTMRESIMKSGGAHTSQTNLQAVMPWPENHVIVMRFQGRKESSPKGRYTPTHINALQNAKLI